MFVASLEPSGTETRSVSVFREGLDHAFTHPGSREWEITASVFGYDSPESRVAPLALLRLLRLIGRIPHSRFREMKRESQGSSRCFQAVVSQRRLIQKLHRVSMYRPLRSRERDLAVLLWIPGHSTLFRPGSGESGQIRVPSHELAGLTGDGFLTPLLGL